MGVRCPPVLGHSFREHPAPMPAAAAGLRACMNNTLRVVQTVLDYNIYGNAFQTREGQEQGRLPDRVAPSPKQPKSY